MTDDNVVDLKQRRLSKPSPGMQFLKNDDLAIEEDGVMMYPYYALYELDGETQELMIYAESDDMAERRIQAIMRFTQIVGRIEQMELPEDYPI